ncbi:MAG: Holliday junction branch migration protein RuvA [Nitrospirota bacterium]|nr:Holliday junction branch migration protein RuvA [Nitrospirota bacterium]
MAFKAPSHMTLDVHGVGYEVLIPLSTFYALPELNETTSVSIHTHVREDAIQLFGFLTLLEKEAFILLTGISGIGPKLALSVLSSLSVADLISAVRAGDVEKLATVPGVGKKTAARIALEIKDKIGRLAPGAVSEPTPSSEPLNQLQEDALSALVNLGYKPAEVKQALKRVAAAPASTSTLQEVIREVLKDLAKG